MGSESQAILGGSQTVRFPQTSFFSQSKVVIDSNGQFLFRAQITLRRLNGSVTKQKLDLLEIATVFAAELGAGPAKVVSPESLDPDLFGALFDNRPNGPVAETFPFDLSDLSALQYRAKQPAVLHARSAGPGIDGILHPDRHRHGPDASSLPFQICKNPPAFTLLNGL